jgi:16S rRNA (cytosine1402-N4)-methyltransferase
MGYQHVPVMLPEVLDSLQPRSGQTFIDGTLGGAGYTLALARAVGPSGRVLAIDLDDLAIANAQEKLAASGLNNVIIVQDNFGHLEEIIAQYLPDNPLVDGVVFDLGLSSAQLDDEQRGFSFQGDRPLDMAFSQSGATAIPTADIVNHYTESHLIQIFRDYGGEPQAAALARALIKQRRAGALKTTGELTALIAQTIRSGRGRINPATRIFQALRIATNRELETLAAVLPVAARHLKTGGRLAVVSFHSGEDRIVKDFFRQESRDCLCPPQAPVCICQHQASLKIITKKPIPASDLESGNNPRARSAKLRVAQKL